MPGLFRMACEEKSSRKKQNGLVAAARAAVRQWIRVKSLLFREFATWGNGVGVFSCQDIGRRGFCCISQPRMVNKEVDTVCLHLHRGTKEGHDALSPFYSTYFGLF